MIFWDLNILKQCCTLGRFKYAPPRKQQLTPFACTKNLLCFWGLFSEFLSACFRIYRPTKIRDVVELWNPEIGLKLIQPARMWGSHRKIANVNFSSHLFHVSKFDASEYMMIQGTLSKRRFSADQYVRYHPTKRGQETEWRRPAGGPAMKRVSIAVTRAITSCCSWYSSWRSNWKSFVFWGWKVGFNFQTCLNNLIYIL